MFRQCASAITERWQCGQHVLGTKPKCVHRAPLVFELTAEDAYHSSIAHAPMGMLRTDYGAVRKGHNSALRVMLTTT
eukprot:COSAG01_NODE_48971_length_376_cov_0.927798_1_plen_76_part_10